MDKQQREVAGFAMTCVIFVVWLGVVAWSVKGQIDSRREARESIARLERLAAEQEEHAEKRMDRAEEMVERARGKRGGDGASIITPAPSGN